MEYSTLKSPHTISNTWNLEKTDPIDYDEKSCTADPASIKPKNKYTPDFSHCCKCQLKLGLDVYQSRCGHLYCLKCVPSTFHREYLPKCSQCEQTELVLAYRDTTNVNKNYWDCLCFECYYEV